ISRLTGDSRIAAGVITGVGFLGAGAIVREGLQPRGLTTAASIWAVASIGLALGLGTGLGYALASVTTVLTFATLAFSDKRLDALFPPRDEVDLAITLDVDRLSIEQLSALFEARGIHAKHVKILLIERVGDARQARVGVQVHVRHSQRLRELIVELAARPEIARISTSEVPPT
ncbi:MAG TPA: MgtC/SapB family protein, partial [Candidatus Baltobacteraceae bacterium]|nr:MgtC/SapB family protein [Candidatus Baltobacteraceae bacterium]